MGVIDIPMLSEPSNATAADILAGLTEPQREAAAHTEGPLLVLAGAGSGKTSVITRRAAYIAATVARPHEVLAITFTNKAAGEMRDRVEALGFGRSMTVCTFHSLCARLLRVYHNAVGLSQNFTIYDQDDSRAVIKRAIRSCEFDSSNWPVSKVQAQISHAKNDLLDPDAFEKNATHWHEEQLSRLYFAYQKILTKEQGLDFDDLLMKTALALQHDEELRARLEDRYRYVLIDEYQDTNEAQYRIAHLLTQKHGNLCATGDPDQSIYGWRGANIKNILRFEEDHEGAKVVRLEQNYRSTKRILSAASRLILANAHRKKKDLWTENPEGKKVRVVECENAEEEADFICAQLRQAMSGGRSANDLAIFYRLSSLSLALELALTRAGVPYQIARGQAFYGRREIKDLLAYIRVLINPADATSLRRIINTPTRGIGKTTVSKLETAAQRTGRSMLDVVMDPAELQALGRGGTRVAEFARLLQELKPYTDGPAADALRSVFDKSGLHASLRGQETVDEIPLENVDNLIAEAKKFDEAEPEGTLVNWLEQTALLGDADTIDEHAGRVTLMTLHASKGLEFPMVFIVGLEDELLPFRRDQDDWGDKEEERRLCFVGMTRTKEELTLTHTRWRMRRGRIQRNVRSPFIEELPAEEIEWLPEQTDGFSTAGSRHGRSAPSGQLPHDIEQWQVGTLVRHPRYDLGQVIAIRRGASRTHATIKFQSGDQQTFVLEFADLTRVDFDEVG